MYLKSCQNIQCHYLDRLREIFDVTVRVFAGKVFVIVLVIVLKVVVTTGGGVTVLIGVDVTFVTTVRGTLTVTVYRGTLAAEFGPSLVMQYS